MKFFTPNSKEELYNFLAEKENNSESVKILAGGTALTESLSYEKVYPDFIVDIKKIEELKEINYKYEEETLSIGSAVTLTEITENDYINDEFEILVDSVLEVPFRPIRNMATIGGNLFDPNSVIAPVLLLANASLKMRDSNGEIVTLPISEFYSKYDKNIFVESIEIPTTYFNLPAKFAKATEDWNNDYESLVNLVTIVTNDNKIRFAESACSDYPLFLGEYSLSLEDTEIIEEILKVKGLTFDSEIQKRLFKEHISNLIEFGKNPDEEIMFNSTVDEKMHTFFTTDKKTLFELLKEEDFTKTPYLVFNGRVVDSRYIFSIEAKDAQIDTVEHLLTFEDSTAYKLFKSFEKHKVSDSKQYLKEILMLFYEIVRENPSLKTEDIRKIIEVVDISINFENLVTAIQEFQK